MQKLSAELAAAMLTRAGLSDADARETAAHIDDTMKDCILALYRSGRDVFREWGPGLMSVTLPGLVLWGADDAYAAPAYAERIGEVTGARVVTLPCGHWWQIEQPEAAARAILGYRRDVGV